MRFPSGHSIRRASALFIVLAVLIGSGCSTGRGGRVVSESESKAAGDAKIRADAYQFNARLWRQGKPTTFKLYLYVTDSSIGLSGTAYLGKGAFQGWLSHDSIKVYFPTNREYVYEPIASFGEGAECPAPLASLNLFSVLTTTPDSLSADGAFAVESGYDDSDHPQFTVNSSDQDCPWMVEAEYRREENTLRLRKFDFRDGRDTRLRGELNRFRGDAEVPVERFRVELPADAVRILP